VLQDNLNLVTSGRSNLRHGGRNPSGERKRLDGMHILVVDDNALNQTVASELLKAQGATVAVAANGQAGVDAVRNSVQNAQPFDTVLMDMQMPVMDGCTATRIIRTELMMTELPIIAMTAIPWRPIARHAWTPA
jgi:CheY-like chemotaxis protein